MPVVQDYTAILSGASINEATGKGAFYTYSFLTSVPADYHGAYTEEALATFRPLTDAEKTAARQALNAWAAISGLTLFEVPAAEGDIRFGSFDLSIMRPGAAGFAYFPSGLGDFSLSSDVFLDSNYAGDAHVLLHEIGHALGFKHTFDGDVTLDPSIDNFGSSVMSYTSGGFPGNVLGTLDRQAVQYLYGDASADGDQVASWSWNATTHTLTQTGFGVADKIAGVGTADIIFGMGGNDIVAGRGGNDQIDGGEGDDDLRGGTGDDTLLGGLGNDRLDGSDGKDRLEGGDSDDTLFGGAGDDNLLGGEGVDYLDGGAGKNSLDGGGGNDTLYASGNQNILNGGTGNDTISASGTQNVLKGGDGNDNLYLYFAGQPFAFQVDGGIGTDLLGITVEAATMNPVLSIPDLLAAGSTLVNVESFALWGNDNGDRITGSGSGDYIQGGTGNDDLSGGGGNDNLVGGNGSDKLNGGEGTDTLNGGESADTLTGGAGGDSLYGGAGADRFVYTLVTDSTSLAQDYISGFETGIDKIDLSALTGATVSWTDHVYSNSPAHYSNVTVTVGGATMIIFVDGIVAAGDFLLTAPPILGTSGPDSLQGTSGPDTIDGKGGADFMRGYAGNDIYYIDNAADRVAEAAGGGSDTVITNVSYALGAGQEIETLQTYGSSSTAAINLTGNEFGQTILGNAAANVIDGRAGGDAMRGFAGNDTYYVDNALDTTIEAGGGGSDTVITKVSYTLAVGQEIELLQTYGSASTSTINLNGNELGQTILGNAAPNSIDGKGGADLMRGYAGNDIYYVDNGLDKVVEAAGGGNDTVVTNVSYSLAAGQEIETLRTYGSVTTNAINLNGNELGQTLIGNDGINVIDGKGGADALYGYAGADTFAFTTALGGGNVDRLGDFQSGTDRIALGHATFSGLGLGALNANAFFLGTAAHDADDRILYNSATGQILFDADGNGSGAAILFATLNPGTMLAASDFTVI